METSTQPKNRTRSILLMVIILSLVCYCIGFAVLQVNEVTRRVPTVTATQNTLTPTATVTINPLTPTPLYITSTFTVSPTITLTFTPSLTFTPFIPPTSTPSPTPVIVEPTITNTPEFATPIVVTATSETSPGP